MHFFLKIKSAVMLEKLYDNCSRIYVKLFGTLKIVISILYFNVLLFKILQGVFIFNSVIQREIK